MSPTTERDEVERFLLTGDYNAQSGAWPGDFISRERAAAQSLKLALIDEVRKRSSGAKEINLPSDFDSVALARRKLLPMVQGLFPGSEQAIVLGTLEKSVVFVDGSNIAQIIQKEPWLHSAWVLANLYLASIGAELLGPDAPRLVGISEETTCYLTNDYWDEDDQFTDFLVHEAAHIFHNCKRSTVGLPETRTREWLLEIDYRKRETFAYACEAYSRIIDISKSREARRRLLMKISKQRPPPDDRVDAEEYLDILREAVEARNGWKRIHARCAPRRTQRNNSGNKIL